MYFRFAVCIGLDSTVDEIASSTANVLLAFACFDFKYTFPIRFDSIRFDSIRFDSIRFDPIWSCPILSCPVLSCPALSCPVLSCPVLSCPVLSCPVLSCPALSCPVLSCPVLSCPVRCYTCTHIAYVSVSPHASGDGGRPLDRCWPLSWLAHT